MKYETATILFAFFGLAAAAPMQTLNVREVPQEHSHEKFLTAVRTSLNLDNPDEITDPVFGLLGNAAASGGLGKITDADCLQQATADQAFTNAKAAGDLDGQVAALIYRSLERNTGKVGLASVLCTKIQAKNPEIAAITQHQDPASAGAAAINKDIVLELAKQIESVGGNPQDALQSGTFEPGDVRDNTGKGNTCDDLDDPEGCIFTQNLLVEDATAAEIDAAVGGAADSSATSTTETASSTSPPPSTCPTPVTVTVTADASATAVTSASSTAIATASSTVPATSTSTAAADGNDNQVQKFTGTLGGAAPAVIETAGADRPFSVNGNTFANSGAAISRSCDIQKNACANAANSGQLAGGVGQCETQRAACSAANQLPRA